MVYTRYMGGGGGDVAHQGADLGADLLGPRSLDDIGRRRERSAVFRILTDEREVDHRLRIQAEVVLEDVTDDPDHRLPNLFAIDLQALADRIFTRPQEVRCPPADKDVTELGDVVLGG